MTRQKVINGAVGAVMGYGAPIIWNSGHPLVAILIIVAWLIGMINNLIPE